MLFRPHGTPVARGACAFCGGPGVLADSHLRSKHVGPVRCRLAHSGSAPGRGHLARGGGDAGSGLLQRGGGGDRNPAVSADGWRPHRVRELRLAQRARGPVPVHGTGDGPGRGRDQHRGRGADPERGDDRRRLRKRGESVAGELRDHERPGAQGGRLGRGHRAPPGHRDVALQPATGWGHLARGRGDAGSGLLQRGGGGDRHPASGADDRRPHRVRELRLAQRARGPVPVHGTGDGPGRGRDQHRGRGADPERGDDRRRLRKRGESVAGELRDHERPGAQGGRLGRGHRAAPGHRDVALQPATGWGHLARGRGDAGSGLLQRGGGGDRHPASGADDRRPHRVRELRLAQRVRGPLPVHGTGDGPGRGRDQHRGRGADPERGDDRRRLRERGESVAGELRDHERPGAQGGRLGRGHRAAPGHRYMARQSAPGRRGHLACGGGDAGSGLLQRGGGGDRHPASGADDRRPHRVRELRLVFNESRGPVPVHGTGDGPGRGRDQHRGRGTDPERGDDRRRLRERGESVAGELRDHERPGAQGGRLGRGHRAAPGSPGRASPARHRVGTPGSRTRRCGSKSISTRRWR